MEAFTLLKYWRGGGAASSIPIPPPPPPVTGSRHATTIFTSTNSHDNGTDTDNEEDAAGGDDGSFFDLEFSLGDDVTADDDGGKGDVDDSQGDCADDGDREFDFTLSSSCSASSSNNDHADLTTTTIAISPSSDEMFGQLVPMMDSSDAFNPKSQRIPVSLLKSATKFRVFLLGFKKSNSKANNNNPVAQEDNKISEVRSTDSAGDAGPESEDDESGKQSKPFTVKFKVEEVPIVSLFTSENSSSSSSSSNKSSSPMDNADNTTSPAAAAAASDERQRFSKEALQKYLKKVKPLYVRVSKRYGEKLRFTSSSGQLTLTSSAVNKAGGHITLKSSPSISTMSAEKIQLEAVAEKSEVHHQVTNTTKQVGAKQGNLQAGLRVVCKHLGKSRSASSAAVAAAPSPPSSNAAASQRRDDSLLQQQDGIQSAILHCKRSFNTSRDSEYSRKVWDTSQEKSTESSANDDGETSSG